MLKWYIPGVDSWIGATRCYHNHFSGGIVSELHDWMGNHPHVIPYPNVSESICYKVNRKLLKKHKHFLQISVRGFQNHLTLPVDQGGFSGALYEEFRVCIGDTSLRKYIPKNINPKINIKIITCVCETCISTMLLQYNLNKLQLILLKNMKSYISMSHQPGFYKYQRNVMMNKIIITFQNIHTLILDLSMLLHHIIFLSQ